MSANAIFFKLLATAGRILNYLQGKGYGSASISTEIASASKFLPNSPLLAIDIGANIGKYTQSLRNKYSLLEIHSFEPSKQTFSLLTALLKNDSNTTLVNLGLGERHRIARLFTDAPGSGLASLSRRRLEHFGIDMSIEETVQIIPFKEYWQSNLNSRNIDFVKIDVEGHELEVLRGFDDAIKFCRVIQFEFGGCNIDTRTFFQDFWYFFTSQSFEIYRVTPIGPQLIEKYSESDEIFQTTNYIAVNTSLSVA